MESNTSLSTPEDTSWTTITETETVQTTFTSDSISSTQSTVQYSSTETEITAQDKLTTSADDYETTEGPGGGDDNGEIYFIFEVVSAFQEYVILDNN